MALAIMVAWSAWITRGFGEDRIVTNTLDSGTGSLREAIQFANANAETRILFNIPTSDPNYHATEGIWVIQPRTALPDLMRGTVIDGSSQPGDTNPFGPEIVLNGSLIIAYESGFLVEAADSVIHHFVIQSFPADGVTLSGNHVTGCHISGCYIGTDHLGTTSIPNGGAGVQILNGAQENTIGGEGASDMNVISGNGSNGIVLDGANNAVVGNYVGVDRSGLVAIPNGGQGIAIRENGSQVGRASAALPNIIAGNSKQGILLQKFVNGPVTDTKIVRTYIGLGSDGNTLIPNQLTAVLLETLCQRITIGGASEAERNLIAGSPNAGIVVSRPSTEILIQGNHIGLDHTGSLARPNQHGIDLRNARNARVLGNVISGNHQYGIACGARLVFSATDNLNIPNNNVIAGNIIGLNAAGLAAVPNGRTGIAIYHLSWGNTIGGPNAEDRNVIAGNGNWGVHIGGPFNDLGPAGSGRTGSNKVYGNWIGTPAAGSASVGNAWGGVAIEESTNNDVGGPEAGMRNVISGNATQGIAIFGLGAANNRIQGNYIGLTPDGLAILPTTSSQNSLWSGAGINIWNGAQDNFIGGTAPGQGNYISGNMGSAITLSDNGTTGHFIYGNTIGLLINRQAAGNGRVGIALWDHASNNAIGGTVSGTGNTICHHADAAITMANTGTTNNPILGNAIFANDTNPDHVPVKLFWNAETGPGLIDGLDNDFGPNGLQNAPVLQFASVQADGLTVTGTLFTTLHCSQSELPRGVFRFTDDASFRIWRGSISRGRDF